jgi:predicted DNA-binding protein
VLSDARDDRHRRDRLRTTLAFRAPEPLDRELKALANREGNPLSAIIRRLIRVGLDNERRTTEGGAR